jgi:hypothetical protein
MGFNRLKSRRYHLEHNFGHGKENLSEAFFVLNLLAFPGNRCSLG